MKWTKGPHHRRLVPGLGDFHFSRFLTRADLDSCSWRWWVAASRTLSIPNAIRPVTMKRYFLSEWDISITFEIKKVFAQCQYIFWYFLIPKVYARCLLPISTIFTNFILSCPQINPLIRSDNLNCKDVERSLLRESEGRLSPLLWNMMRVLQKPNFLLSKIRVFLLLFFFRHVGCREMGITKNVV